MAHAAALYTVRVKERYGDYQPLGDFDRAGSWLLDVLDRYLDDFTVTSPDGDRVARCLRHEINGDQLAAAMQHGQSGLAADIISDAGVQRLRQVMTDTSLVQCGCLFVLPPDQTTGWLALHVNNGRGIKGLLDQGIPPQFGQQFTDHMLEIRPLVRQSALREAIDNNRVQKVRLIRYERPNDRAASTDKWVQPNEIGKIELDISMRGRGQMLVSSLLRRLFDGDQVARDEIVEFEGMTFETVKVEVDVGGRVRTYNLGNLTAGHPMTIDITPDVDDDGEPAEESLFVALREALTGIAE